MRQPSLINPTHHRHTRLHQPRMTRITLSTLLLLLCLCSAGMAQTQTVTRPIPLTSEQNEMVLLSFYTCGGSDRTGRSIAVVDSIGQGVPYKLLAHDPEGQSVLALDVRTAARPLRLTYGPQPNALSKQDNALTPSLVLQTFQLTRRGFKDANEFRAAYDPAKPLGTALIGDVFLGHNPFGQGTDFVTLIQARLNVSEPGEYWMIPLHDDAAILEINGKLIYGRLTPNTGLDRDTLGQSAVKVTLDAGMHTLRLLHAQTDGSTVLVMGMRQGSDPRIIGTVPSRWYARDPMVALDFASEEGERAPVAFDAEQLDQLANEDQTFTRFRLRPIVKAPAGGRYRFEFSDGTSLTTAPSDGASEPAWVEHIFPALAGEWPSFRVSIERLSADGKSQGRGTAVLRTQVFSSTATIGDRRLLEQYIAAINATDYANAKPELYAALYPLVDAMEQPALTAPLAESFITRFAGRTGRLMDQMKLALALHLSGSDPQRAAKLFEELSTTTSDPWQSATAAAEQMDLMIFRLGLAKDVAPMVSRLTVGKTARERALLRARLGDSLRVMGKLDEAEKVYRDAQPDALRRLDANMAAVQERACREKVLSLFEQRRYRELREALLEWEADFPIAKLGGDLPLMRGRYFQETGDDARAEAEYRTILALNPLHPSKPEITFRMAQSLMRLGKKDEATALFNGVARDYPNSPFAQAAKAQGTPSAGNRGQ